jgi:hypothetical protein
MYTIRLLWRSSGSTGIVLVTASLFSFTAYLLDKVSTIPVVLVLIAGLIVALATPIAAAVWEIRSVSSRRGADDDDDDLPGHNAGPPRPFLARMVVADRHHRDPRRAVWRPRRLTVEMVKRHALSTDAGISLLRSLYDTFTWVLEYKVQAFWRVLRVDWKLGWYGRAYSLEGAYECIMNTSLACFLDKNTGDVILYDTWLSHGTRSSKLYYKITFTLDHKQKTCQSVCFEEKRACGEPTTLTEAEEIGVVVLMVIALKTHVNVHYHANGVSELTSYWPLAHTSSALTQALNRAAVFVAPFYMANHVYEVDHHAEVVGSNMIVEGLPFQEHLAQWAEDTSTQKILAKARPLLLLALSKMMSNVGIKERHMFAEAILAATILHSADHYYIDTCLGYRSRCEFLKVDMTFLRTALAPPNHYYTHRFLCRQYPHDAICQALYRAALAVDPVFANTALFVGIAN